MRVRAILFGVVAAIAISGSAAAETSSWIMETTEIPKPRIKPQKKGKPVKAQQQAPNEGAHTFQGKAAPAESLAKYLVPATGDDAAFIAFDQGQYLTAKRLAEEGVKRNEPQSFTLLGRLYAEGLGVSQDLLTAAKWYARADQLGDLQATFSLGLMFAEGKGVKKDRQLAGELFEKAARTGHPLANYNLGLLFLTGDGKPQNEYRAAMHIRYAAEKGVVAAQYDLAGLYQNGSGVEPSALEASNWLSKAAEQGMPEAQLEYAIVLLRGLGLTKDEPKAIPYLRAAANKGIASAQNRLAHVYANGVLVEKSSKEAARWRLIAKAAGLEDPKLDELVAKLPLQQQIALQREAMEWREEAGLF
jgi:TPR repeat protein